MLKINKTPEAVVENQLKAYNQRSLNEFLSFYSNDIKIYNFNKETPF